MVSPHVFRLCCLVALTLRHVAGSTIRRHVRGGVAIQSNVTMDWSNATIESSPSTASSALAAAAPKRPSPVHRALVEDHNFFVPLTCNTIPCSVKKSNWTLEDYAAQTEMVVIPCGHCILLDYMMDEETSLTVNGRSASSARAYPSPRNVTLELPFGIDIQGSLYIPGNAHQYNRLTIVTPFVLVQGKLSIKTHANEVGAVPNVKFLFTDNPIVETTFVPTGNNVYACSDTQSGSPTPCIVGPKSLVVAGGQLHIRGLATKCASWVHLYDVVDRPNGLRSDIIVRDQGVWGCWGSGAQILITSHTTDFESAQLRTIIAEPTLYGRGLVRLSLDDLVVPSVTLRHNDSFAVEVALLSRNILFEAAPDASDPLLGGHLTIMNTPKVVQIIQGVEIRNFGRQGEIGRYPIHFHLSDSVFGSVVAKNSIRYSNQRCVVAHGTHNLTITNNVAHETFGHCFMLEDGGERHNSFIRNLGASTRAATRLVRPFESDASNPSTFWCSNPVNTWIGNVAAGSANSGYWFELQRMVRPPTSLMKSSIGLPSPRQLRLKLFVDNVAHSNAEHGLRTFRPCYMRVIALLLVLANLLFLCAQVLIRLGSNLRSKLSLTIRDRTRTIAPACSFMKAFI
jgi:hypothetical protein